ncbi:MAG: flagellin [Ignavibacteriales bacterium]|nr:flagellin [Ignavibacteriales bacterium]
MAGIGLTSGMRSNLISLQQTTTLMEAVQGRLATGKKVNTALDNPVNYFTASNHEARATKLDAKKDMMNEAIQTQKAAAAGIEGVKKLIEAARGIAQSALTATGTQLTSLKTSYDAVLTQIDDLANDSGYSGKNLLKGDTLTVYFNEDNSSKLDIVGFDAATSGDITLSALDTADIQSSLDEIDSSLNTIETQAKSMSSTLNVVQTRFDFTQGLINTLKAGAAKLTDADMNEEGANLLMLQTRQQLATTSLSMASQSAQSVLRLF